MSSPAMKRKNVTVPDDGEVSGDDSDTSSSASPDPDSPPTIVTKDRKTPGVSVRMTLLPEGFEPSENDVLCGRGGVCKNWPGNIAYRQLVQSKLEEYSKADTKHLKGVILDDVVKHVREKAGVGGFVKKDQTTQRWYEVGDFLAREKTSQCFRDALHEQYTSSAHAKYKRRKLEIAESNNESARASGDSPSHGAANSSGASPMSSHAHRDEQNSNAQQGSNLAILRGAAAAAANTTAAGADPTRAFASAGVPTMNEALEQANLGARKRAVQLWLSSMPGANPGQQQPHQLLTSISEESSQEGRRANAETLAALGLGGMSDADSALRQLGIAQANLAYVPGRDAPPRSLTSSGLLELEALQCHRMLQQQLQRAIHIGPSASAYFPRDLLTGQTSLSGDDLRAAFIQHHRDSGSLAAALQRARTESCAQRAASSFIERLTSMSQTASNPIPTCVSSCVPQTPGVQPYTVAPASPVQPSTTVGVRNGVQICAMQPLMRKPSETLMDATQRVIQSMDEIAAREKVDLFVLPELCPVGYCEDTFRNYLPGTPKVQSLYHQIDYAFASQACKLETFISYGTIGWKERDDGSFSFTIRQIVLDRSGTVVASYDKVNLCDGVHPESLLFDKGTAEQPAFSINGFKIGLIICADILYPLISRNLVREKKVDVLIQPTAFPRALTFRSWKSIRETRAIENSVYFVAVNYAGDEFGNTSIVPPWMDDEHEASVLTDSSAGYLIGRIDQGFLDHVRSTKPIYRSLMEEES